MSQPQKPHRLSVADPSLAGVPRGRALVESFPNSQKQSRGPLAVPVRVISLAGGQPDLEVYDTSGPEGLHPSEGLPPRRTPWIEARRALGTDNVSQLHYARRGLVTV
jgi:phosphomethylpyrimidine synthase